MIAIVSHDAGGAEVLSSFVRRQGLQPLFVLDGPARNVFERKLGPVNVVRLDDALESCVSLLCGTSGQSDLEFRALAIARALGKHSAAFVDHWINFPERFTRGSQTNLPDEIWVGDTIAEAIARDAFPGLPLRVVANPYFADLRDEFAALPPRRPQGPSLSVLYVTEPLRAYALARHGDERHYGYVEDDALRYFLGNIGVLGAPVARIRIRPHPSEPAGKYAWVGHEWSLPIETSSERTLVADIADSDVVVGCESMALIVGLLAGRRVISCIPPGGRACRLPQSEIEHCQRLLAARDSA
jgi:hypothetical protein